MPDTLTLIRRRRDRRERTRRSGEQRLQRVVMGAGFVFGALLSLLLIGASLAYAEITRDLPPVEQLPVLLNPPDGLLLQPTELYDRSGEHLLATLAPSSGPRRYLPLDPQNPQHLSEKLVETTLAAADPDFWSHPGYTLQGLDRPESHPTLAQRLAADLLLWDEPPSLRRAIRERLLAAQITSRYGRRQVIEWTLNSADYGHYAFGAEQAAQLYFGKSAAELNLGEAAVLAALGQSPALNPHDAPVAAVQNAGDLIQAMAGAGIITVEEANESGLNGITFAPPPASDPTPAPAFVNLALSQLETFYGSPRLERGGLKIITSLDFDLQTQAACAVRAVVAPEADAFDCEAASLLPSLPDADGASASALILDPQTGQILAAVGETGPGGGSAFLAAHDAGSLNAPFVYLTGFTRGLSPASLVWDVPGLASIPNFDGQYHGPLRLREALANDTRVAAAQVLAQMGADNVSRTAASFGLALPENLSWLDEPVFESPLRLAAAYGVFAANGVMAGQPLGDTFSPVSVLSVTGFDHAAWLDWTSPQARAVVSPQLAYLMTHVLSDASVRSPELGYAGLLDAGRPAGAKVGQTPEGRDAWTVGYTPQRVTLVWVGSEAGPSPRLAAGLWQALTRYATRSLPPEGWSAPQGVSVMPVCDPSGMLPTEACPNVVDEVFLSGNEPVQADTLYKTVEVNRETGFLATVFTPPELVDEKVYLSVPPEALDWARANGFDTPPTAYDAIQPPEVSPNANITSPALFADVGGTVTITGSAAADDLDFYRVQVGRGLNPRAWTLVGEGREPVEGERLAVWDTSGLSGLYAVQLLVVHKDQRVETAVIQVTVDNRPPEVAVLDLQEGETLSLAKNRQVVFQAQASDDLLLKEVAFYLDGKLVGTAYAAPYSAAWTAAIGKHRLRVVAADGAGNMTEAVVGFEVVK
ncbi:MAG: penicillin-binding protein [Chloroflexota bacterium]